MLVVSSVGGSVVVVVVLVDVVVLVVDVVVDVVVDASWGDSVIDGLTESEPEHPATITTPLMANNRLN